MELSDGDYWRDGVAMSLVDSAPDDAVAFAVIAADDGAEFNIAIWAAIKLRDLVFDKYGWSDADGFD